MNPLTGQTESGTILLLFSSISCSFPSVLTYFTPSTEHCRKYIVFSVSVPVLSVKRYWTCEGERW